MHSGMRIRCYLFHIFPVIQIVDLKFRIRNQHRLFGFIIFLDDL